MKTDSHINTQISLTLKKSMFPMLEILEIIIADSILLQILVQLIKTNQLVYKKLIIRVKKIKNI